MLVPQQKKLNEDLDEFYNWPFQLKMNFNLDPSKQVQEVLFCKKIHQMSCLHFSNAEAM